MSAWATITITLDVESETPGLSLEVLNALHNLGSVMATQAEDGLYALGWQDCPDEEGNPNTYLGALTVVSVGVT